MSTRKEKEHDTLFTIVWVVDHMRPEIDYPSGDLHGGFLNYVQRFNLYVEVLEGATPLSEPTRRAFTGRLNKMSFLEYRHVTKMKDGVPETTNVYRLKPLEPSRFETVIDIIRGVLKWIRSQASESIKKS